jgi:aromatic-L-amino-acid decarboxylase
VKGIQDRLREHIRLAQYFEEQIGLHPEFEIVVPRNLSVTCFRYKPAGCEEKELNELNAHMLEMINASGKAYLSHTLVMDKFTLRFVCAQTRTEKKHVDGALELLYLCADKINKKGSLSDTIIL